MKIFLSYAHKDSAARAEIEAGLKFYVSRNKVTLWIDTDLLAGDAPLEKIQKAMDDSEMIIFLLSRSFMGSDFIMKNELPIASKKHKNQSARIVPVLLEDISLNFIKVEFGTSLNAIPKNKDEQLKPIKKWADNEQDEAWKQVIKAIEEIINSAGAENVLTITSDTSASKQPVEDNTTTLQLNPKGQGNGRTSASGTKEPQTTTVVGSVYQYSDVNETIGDLLKTGSEVFEKQFDAIAGTTPLTTELMGLMTQVRLDDGKIYSVGHKCQVIGALTISLMKQYDRSRILLLMDYIEDKETLVWKRAMTGLVLALTDKENEIDDLVDRRLHLLIRDSEFQLAVTDLSYSLYLVEKQKYDRNLLQNPTVYEKIEFFKKDSNWFLPFHKDNPHLKMYIKRSEVSEDILYSISLGNDLLKYAACMQFNGLSKESRKSFLENLNRESDYIKKIVPLERDKEKMIEKDIIYNYVLIISAFLQQRMSFPWAAHFTKTLYAEEIYSYFVDPAYLTKIKAIQKDESYELDEAIELYGEYLVGIGKTDMPCHRFMGYCCYENGRYKEATKYLEMSYAVDPLCAKQNMILGIINQGKEKTDFAESVTYHTKAYYLDPSNGYNLRNLAYAYQKVNPPDFSQALNYHLLAENVEPNIAWNLSNIGFCYQCIPKPDYEMAVEYQERAKEIDPKDSWNIGNLGLSYQNLNPPEFKMALECHSKTLELSPNDSWNWKMLGFCYQNISPPDFVKALEYHLRFYDSNSKDPWNLKNIGYCYQHTDPPAFDLAMEYLQRAYHLNPKDEWTLRQIGYCFQKVAKPDYEQALKFHLSAFDINPNNTWNLSNIGSCYQNLAQPDFESALKYHLKAYELDPDDTWNTSNLGYCYQNIPQPDFETALKYHLLANLPDSKDEWNLRNIGYCYQKIPNADFQKALEFHLKAYEIKPDQDWNLRNIGYCYQKIPSPDFQKALECHLKAFDLNPHEYLNLANIGYCYQCIPKPNYEEALSYHLKCYDIRPDYVWNLKNIGFCYQCIKEPDFRKALEFHLKVLSSDPEDTWNLQNIGYCYLRIEPSEYDRALEYFLQSDKLLPNHDYTLGKIGFCYQKITPPDFEKAYEYHLRSYELNPAETWNKINLGWCLFVKGDIAGAKKMLEEAVAVSTGEDKGDGQIILAHIAVVENNWEEATKLYQEGRKSYTNNEEFVKACTDDYKYLASKGVDKNKYEEFIKNLSAAPLESK